MRPFLRGMEEKNIYTHNQMGFHFSRLLVGVWHEATHKVGLAVVQLKVWSHQTHLSKSIISLKQAPP